METKDFIKEILTEIFDELKSNFATYLKEEILPAGKEAKDDFVAKLTDESAQTNSVWVKIRNALICVIVNVLGNIVTKFVNNIISVQEG